MTALAALVATLAVDSVDLPAVGGGVLAWVVVWFVLGYAVYATAFGALGSLASRTEDASSVAAPVSYVLIAAYWVSYVAVASDPEGGWSQLVSYFPATAPFAMPGRIALGVTEWWEPVVAAAVASAALALLVTLAGRLYSGAPSHGTDPQAPRSLASHEGIPPERVEPGTGGRRASPSARRLVGPPGKLRGPRRSGATLGDAGRLTP